MTTTETVEEEILLPWDAVPSKATQENYLRLSRWFLEFGRFIDPAAVRHKPGPSAVKALERQATREGMVRMVRELRSDPQAARTLVVQFIRKVNERIDAGEVADSWLESILKPVRLAFELNEILIPWKKYARLIHKGRTNKKDREYFLHEIRLLLSKASPTMRMIILIMAASGVRIGAFDYLKVGHVMPVYRLKGKLVVPKEGAWEVLKEGKLFLPDEAELLCGIVKVYADEPEDEYDGLITREAYLAWKAYVEARIASGEKVTQDSPAIVVRNGSRRWTSDGVTNAMNDLLWKVGLRTQKKRRHEVQMDHGFRKYFDNVVNDHIDKVYVEMLIGHTPQALGVRLSAMEHYDRHLPTRAIEQYVACMPYLSIDEGYRSEAELTERLAKAEGEKDELVKDLRYDIMEKGQKIEQLQTKYDRILELLGKGTKVDPKLLDVKSSELG
jgi:hypothetical protein